MFASIYSQALKYISPCSPVSQVFCWEVWCYFELSLYLNNDFSLGYFLAMIFVSNLCVDFNVLCWGSSLVMLIWVSKSYVWWSISFQVFGEIFCNNYIKLIFYAFSFYIWSFFYTMDSWMLWICLLSFAVLLFIFTTVLLSECCISSALAPIPYILWHNLVCLWYFLLLLFDLTF